MVDRYTKVVLTVIAVCLVILAFSDIRPITKANAQTGPVHVIIDSTASFAFQFAGPLQVHQ
jgi:hypothetical protein